MIIIILIIKIIIIVIIFMYHSNANIVLGCVYLVNFNCTFNFLENRFKML